MIYGPLRRNRLILCFWYAAISRAKGSFALKSRCVMDTTATSLVAASSVGSRWQTIRMRQPFPALQ